MFCIKCGKKARVGNFCEACFAGMEELFAIKDFRMFYCDRCGIKEDEIKSEIESKIKTDNRIDSRRVEIKIVGNKVHAAITCEGRIKGVQKKEEKKLLVVLMRKMCDMHVKLSGGYYEALIQVRGQRKGEIMRLLGRLLPKKSIVDVEALKEGYNIKIMNKATAAAAARSMYKKFTVIDSYKLVGSKKGRKLYRNFYAIR